MSEFLPPNAPQDGPGDDLAGDDNAISEMIVRYLNDMLPEREARHLGELLDGDVRLQTLFVRLARLHGLMAEWGRFMIAERESENLNLLLDEDEEANASRSASLHDAMTQQALTDSDVDDSVDGPPLRAPPAWKQTSRGRQALGLRRWLAAAAAIAAATGVFLTVVSEGRRSAVSSAVPRQNRQPVVRPIAPAVARASSTFPNAAPPPAVITGSAAAALGKVPLLRPGSSLVTGQAIELTSGALEVTFDSGVVVAITAPAHFRILDRNRMALDRGSLAAHVPPSGVGFRVDGADMTVVDQGTDFGMRPSEREGATELDVFKGSVDAVAHRAADHATTAPAAATRPIRVTGGNAVVCASADPVPLRPTPYSPEKFVHTIEEYRIAIPLHGTSADVPFKSRDPNWTLVADPSGMFDPPRPVYAIEMRPAYFFAASPASKWISNGPQATDAPPGRFTFRTTVVLPEFAPGTASVTGTWGADDQLVDVIVNGTSTAEANADMMDRVNRTQPATWLIQGAPWRPGDNQVDVIVLNKTSPRGVLNQMALNVSFSATVAPVVSRSNGASSTTRK